MTLINATGYPPPRSHSTPATGSASVSNPAAPTPSAQPRSTSSSAPAHATSPPTGDFVYTVIDWRNGIRGPVNVIGQSVDISTDEGCRDLLDDLEAGRWEISHRNRVQLDILDRGE